MKNRLLVTDLWRVVAAISAAAWIAGSNVPRLRAADDILQRSRAMYGELRSYADTGVVLEEYGSGSKDRHAFTTNFNRAPRRFSFDFSKDGGDRYVVWGDPDAFHTWWKATGARHSRAARWWARCCRRCFSQGS